VALLEDRIMGKKSIARVYRIVVRSELGGRYASAFEGMRMETRNGRTILTGEVEDQPRLFGILGRLNGLGLELLSVQVLSEDARPIAEGIESRSDEPGS
jgi:hypothetical protein